MNPETRADGTHVGDFVEVCDSQSATQCFLRARLCNRLAKLVTGGIRHRLYHLTNHNLAEAQRRDPSVVCTTGDHDLHWGFLSMALKANPAIRVHTHENWWSLN